MLVIITTLDTDTHYKGATGSIELHNNPVALKINLKSGLRRQLTIKNECDSCDLCDLCDNYP